MREIKFRYRLESYSDNTIEPFFVYVTLEELEEMSAYKGLLDKFTEHDWGEDYNTYHILSRDQYTGLKDKNGKEIYEGDILKDSSKSIVEVKWLRLGVWNICPLTDKKEWQKTIIRNFNKCEVVGNIYESKELIK